MNVVNLVGNLGKDAEVIDTKSGGVLVKLLVAPREHDREKPEWVTVVVKGKLAHTCSRCKKGMKVSIQGRLHTHSWEDKDGKTQYRTEVEANTVDFHTSLKKDEE